MSVPLGATLKTEFAVGPESRRSAPITRPAPIDGLFGKIPVAASIWPEATCGSRPTPSERRQGKAMVALSGVIRWGRTHSTNGHPDSDEGDEGGRHGGQRPADEHAGDDPEHEGERGIADGDQVAAVERGGRERAVGDAVERARPPGHHEAQESGGDHRGQTDQAELGGQPAGAADALGPRQPEGVVLQLAGDQRRAPEDPDEGRERRGPPGRVVAAGDRSP